MEPGQVAEWRPFETHPHVGEFIVALPNGRVTTAAYEDKMVLLGSNRTPASPDTWPTLWTELPRPPEELRPARGWRIREFLEFAEFMMLVSCYCIAAILVTVGPTAMGTTRGEQLFDVALILILAELIGIKRRL